MTGASTTPADSTPARSAAPTPPKPGRREVTQVHVVRVLAMFAVFFYHLWYTTPSTIKGTDLGDVFTYFLKQGGLGVVLFNMTTGFVLMLPHLGKPTTYGIASGFDYFLKRLKRLVPLYYLCFALFTVVSYFVFGPFDCSMLIHRILTFGLLIQNLVYQTLATEIAAYWWVGMVVEFYLLVPLLINLFRRFGWQVLAAICIADWAAMEALTMVNNMGPDPVVGWLFYFARLSVIGRLPDFVLGMLAAVAWKRLASAEGSPRISIAGVVACVAGYVLFQFLEYHAGDDLAVQLIAICGRGASLFALILGSGLAERLGDMPWMKELGLLSYGFYLIHQPLLAYSHKILTREPATVAGFFGLSLTVITATLILAYTLQHGLDAVMAGKKREN